MGSSGGGDSGMGLMALMNQGKPMPGLPIAGQGPGTNAFEYGQFQNFLPDPVAEGENPMATGLRPDMFKYRSPGGVVAGGAGAGGGGSDDIQGLRNELAALQAGLGQGIAPDGTGGSGGSSATAGGAVGGGIGTMGLGRGGFGPAMNGVAPPANATQLPTPPGGWAAGNVPGWPRGGPGTPQTAAGINTDPAAAAAAAAANAASGGGANFSGPNIGPPGDPRIAAAIAANMAAQGGPQKTNFGVPGAAYTSGWQPGMPIPAPRGGGG